MNFAEYKKLKDSGKDTGRTKQSTKQTPNYIQEISGKSAEEIKNNRKREQSGEVLSGKDTSIKTPGAMVKGASFASKREKRKVRQTKAVDAVEKRAGSAIASGNAGILSGNAKNISVLANAIAKSRKSAENVRTPVAATKGSVFVNKGYNPQNKSKSAKETKRLETTAQKTNDFARKMQEKESALDTEGKEGLGKVGSAAYDLGKVGTQLAADATAGLLVPGGGLASVASRSFGQGVMQAEDEGKSGARAVLYGAGNAAIEAGTEKLTAAAKPLKAIYGAGVVDNVLGKLTKKLGSSAKGRSALATIAKAAGGEAAEEALADVLQVPLQRAVLENGAKFDADWAANTAYDALLGGVMGGVLGGGSVAVDRAQNRSTNRAKTMADAMQRAREKNQKKSTGSAPPVMQNRAAQTTPAQTTPTQQETTQNIPAQNTNVNRQQSATAQEPAADPAHIDNRSSAEISSRNVNAFQYDHPEIRQYYREAAEDLLADADLSLQSGTTRRKERTMQGNKWVQETIASPIVRQAMSHGLTRENIIRGAEDIIQDEGAENNANAKRVEQVLDRMVEQGYSTMVGRTVQPNADYVAAKQAIPGGAQRAAAGSWEAYLEENRLSLETGEVTEAQLRAEYEALQRGGGSGTMNANGGAGYGREGQVSESRGTAGRIGREVPERGETDPGGIFGGIQSNGNAIRDENAGRFSLAGQYGVEVNGGGISYGRENDTGGNFRSNEAESGQWRRTNTAGGIGQSNGIDRSSVTSAARRYAGEYGIQVNPVSDEILVQRGHKAGAGFTSDGTVYMSENMSGETVRQFIAHEVVHTMKQNGFEPYLQFTQRTESLLNSSANTENVLANLMDHRGYQGTYDDLDLNQKFTVMDELNAVLYGGYKVNPIHAISTARTIMNDPESYFSELSGIMEQYRTRNDGLGAADRGSLNSPYENLQAQSTRFYPEGANAARPVDVPMYDADGNPISKSASTVLGAKAIPDEVIPQIEQMIADGEMSYTTVKDQDSLRRARTTVERDGFDGAMQEFRTSVNSGKVSKDIMTLGQTLLNTAANNRDGHAVAEILTLYQSMNTNLGQAMQAASILRKLEPESQLYGIRRMVDNLNDVLAKKKKDYDVDIDPELVQKFTEQDTQEGRDAVMQEIYQNVASQVPSTWKEKWDAWRYLAMLGNPRTHIRNIVGNAAFQPVRFLKNEIAAGMEAGLNKLGMNIERTKSFSASPALYRAAWNDYANAKDILGGSKYNEIETAIEKNRRILPGILETARAKNSAALEAEDAIAKRITYADSLAGYLKANGITAEQFMNGEADSGIVNKARNYAAQEALKATYQDKNAFSNRVVDIVSKTGVVGDAIIPFKRTPANILVRSIEYSPIGAVKAVTYDLAKVKSGEKTAAQVIDAAAAGLAGTGLFALGAYMFANGLLTVAQGDDKEDKWAQLLGHQGYALELPDGTSVTIDWLAPDSLPFFMGAEMMSSAGENGWSIESIWNALKSVANPMLDLSMLQSVNDLIDSVKYAESSPLAAMVPSAIVSYFSQAVPTIGGQIERTAGDKRMTTYTEKDGKLPTDFQYAIGKVSAKIPGWDYQQVPYIDEWGREKQTGTPFQRAFNNFLNPAYTSQVDMDKVEESIQSVYDATGEKSVFPDKAERTLTINNEDKNLTASEYEKYAKKLGKERYTLLKEAVNSDAYGKLSNAEKAEFISEVYSYSKAMTEHDLFGKEISKRWYTEAKESGDVLGAIRDHVLYTVNGSYSDKAKTAVEDIGITLDQYAAMRNGLDADGNGAVSQSEAKAYLDGQDFSRDQKSQLWKIINKSWKSNPYG